MAPRDVQALLVIEMGRIWVSWCWEVVHGLGEEGVETDWDWDWEKVGGPRMGGCLEGRMELYAEGGMSCPLLVVLSGIPHAASCPTTASVASPLLSWSLCTRCTRFIEASASPFVAASTSSV